VAVYVDVLVKEAVEVEEYDRLGDNDAVLVLVKDAVPVLVKDAVPVLVKDAVPVLVKDAVEVGEGRTALFVKDGELVNV
jgi:hypothetical protein